MLDPRPSFRKKASQLSHDATYCAALCRAAVRHRLSGAAAPVRMLLLSDGLNYQSECQFDPLARNRRVLVDELGLAVRRYLADPENIRPSRGFAAYDIIGLKFHYKTPAETVLRAARAVAASKGPRSSLVYCDGNDEANIQWPELLGICDVYWKKHILRNRTDAIRRYEGTTNLAHHARGKTTSEAPHALMDTALLDRVCRGTSIGLDGKIFDLAGYLGGDRPQPPHRVRAHDVILRADIPDNWMGALRKPAVRILEGMQAGRDVLLPRGRVSPEQYAREMAESRICVSPFGYGEICWRDFEAVAFGCLLFKPDMGHVESEPDIFRPFETYIPVNWDFSDLREKIVRYADDESERMRIASNARRVLRECLEPSWFVGAMRGLLDKALR